MKFIVYNGSPRGTAGVSNVLVQLLADGIRDDATRHHPVDIFHLSPPGRETELAQMLSRFDAAILVFPVVRGSFPAAVKRFVESLGENVPTRGAHISMYFLVHSAFPNTGQFGPMDRYLQKAVERLGMKFGGLIAVDNQPEEPGPDVEVRPKTAKRLRALGRSLGQTGHLPRELLLETVTEPNLLNRTLAAAAVASPLHGLQWTIRLLTNGVFQRRRNRPLDQGRSK